MIEAQVVGQFTFQGPEAGVPARVGGQQFRVEVPRKFDFVRIAVGEFRLLLHDLDANGIVVAHGFVAGVSRMPVVAGPQIVGLHECRQIVPWCVGVDCGGPR